MTAEGNTPNRFILSLPVCDRAAWDSFHRERCMIYDQQRSNMHTSLWLTCCHRVSCHVTSVGPHVCPHASLLISPGHLSFLPQPSRLPSLLLPSPLFISLCPLLALLFASLFFFPSPPICLTPLSLVEWHIGVKKCCQLALQRSLTAWQSSSSSCEKSERMNKKTSMEKQDVEIIKELL